MSYTEGRFGASAIAVYSFIEEYLILNFVSSVLFLSSVYTPALLDVINDNIRTDQQYAWSNHQDAEDVCCSFQIIHNNETVSTTYL